MTDNPPHESVISVGASGNESPNEVQYSQPEMKNVQQQQSQQQQQLGEAQQWPPKPYFVVNRYIKQTLLPSIRNLPPDTVQNIASVSGIKVLEASAGPEVDQEKAQQEIKYSVPVSPKYNANDWTPMHFSRGVNRYSMPNRMPEVLQQHYPVPISDDYATPLPEQQLPVPHSPRSPSNAHLQLSQEFPQYPRMPSLPSQLPQAAEEILPMQETYKGTFKSPEMYLEKMEHKDTPMKYIEKVVYRQIPTTVRGMEPGSEEDETGSEEVPAHQYQQHHQIKHEPQHHQLPPRQFQHNGQQFQVTQVQHELPVQVRSPYRTSSYPYQSRGFQEPEEENETMGERAPVMFKLPFPKPRFRKVSADSIGALYSKLTCQQFRDPKAQNEEMEFDSGNDNREVNYIYMFKNRLPH